MKNLINKQYILIIILLALPVLAISGDRPAAPSGFSWHVANNGVGTFLKPDGWHVLEETKGSTSAVFISRENIEQHGKFITGFTVNQVTSFASSSPVKASEYAKLYIQKIIDKYEVISSGVVKKGPNDMNVARVKGDNAGVTTIAHHIAVGMDQRDEMYMISFQAPESEWDAYNDIAGQMFSYFLLGS